MAQELQALEVPWDRQVLRGLWEVSVPRVSLGQLVHLAQVLEPEVEGPPVPRELLDLAVQRALLVRLAQRELQAVLDCQVARERRDRVERQDCLEILVQAVA